MNEDRNVIEVEHLDFFLGAGALRKKILQDINLSVNEGEIVILTGPSGSGKSTLLTVLGALRTATTGSVRVLGAQLNGADHIKRMHLRRKIGFVFQAHNLLSFLTGRQNVQMSLELAEELSPTQIKVRAQEALSEVGLADRADYFPSDLSGGQRQRVAIARALAPRPKLLLADEPTAALDKRSGREVIELMQDLVKRHKCSIVLVTHDNRILDVADRVVHMEDGRLVS